MSSLLNLKVKVVCRVEEENYNKRELLRLIQFEQNGVQTYLVEPVDCKERGRTIQFTKGHTTATYSIGEPSSITVQQFLGKTILQFHNQLTH